MKKIFCFIFVFILLISTTAAAVDSYGDYNIPVDIEVNGHFIRCVEKPIMIEGTTYIPLRAFSDAIGGEIRWDNEVRAAIMTKDGHSFAFFPDKDSCLVDGAETNHPSVLYMDLTFIPVRAVSETLGYDVVWDDFYLTVKITAPGVEIAASSIDYSYSYEDILYLGKITQVESGSEPFVVKLGVASVVMNRVNSKQFPNTVKGVIFDTKYGTQFPPAHTSKIEVTPSKESVIAAKCALRGVKVVGNSLYFIQASAASRSWAGRNRPYYGTLNHMAFYE